MDDRIKTFKEAEENIANSSYLYDSFIPAMYGGVIGDALGVPYEFKKRGSFPKVTGMDGYGTYNQNPGTWSDDTSLTLCLIENIIENGDQDSLMKKFVKYYKSGYWTPFGNVFDIGNATRQSIEMYIQGTPAFQCGQSDEFSNGNGALMRIAPLGFIAGCSFDFPRLVKAIEDYAEITHAHPRSTLGCIFYCAFLFRLMHNDDFKGALNIVTELCYRDLVNTKYKDEFIHYDRIFNKSIMNLPMEKIVSDGYVVNSLEAALWCCFKTDNFKDAVLAAVNLGGDTDTIGAITGTIAGTFYKYDAIPKEWINAIARKDDIDSLLNKFCENYFDFRRKYFKPED